MHGRLRDDPVLVLGMHHSGTSILAEVLHRSGVFMHATMHHYESKFFTRDINDRMIMGGGANWTRNPVMSVDEVMGKVEQVRVHIDKKALKKFRKAGYDGQARWGFKDPRTCVTLPLYLAIFPGAQLLHIVRDADDVAVSLARSNKAGLGQQPDRDFWKQLHQQHVERVRYFGTLHPHYFELAYEDFCRHPIDSMGDVLAYLHVDFTEDTKDFLHRTIYTHRIRIA